ncbi:MAG TPA: D-2-hydroxyacid dehydrogenase family protein [Methylovirgula sp.]
MRKLAILDDYQGVALQFADWSAVGAAADITVFREAFKSEQQIAQALSGFEMVCLMRERTPFPASLIEKLPALNFIGVTGPHNRVLDLAAARKHHIVVSCTRGGASEFPTTELTWALILAAARHLPQEDRALRAGAWQTTIGVTLHGRTLGLLGFGRIGQRVASIGNAFGMKVIAWSPNLTPERAAGGGATYVSKDELLSQSDVLSLHMVLSDKSRGIVGADEFKKMRPDAILVNSSRGPLVEEQALLAALKSQRIRAAALDVFDQEPPPLDHPLRILDNVVLTPHLGYVTEEVYSTFFNDTVKNALAYLAGRPIRLLQPEDQA